MNEKNKHLVTDDVLDLISKVLVYDHKMRLSAKESMDHPLFKCLKIISRISCWIFRKC